MSRNYELLEKVEKEAQISHAFPKPASAAPSNGNHRRVMAEPPQNDEVNKLVHRVFSSPGMPGPRAVIFTGVGHWNGSSGVCASVARALAAQSLGTVCAVDANLRSPSLHEHFKVENACGFAEGILRPGAISALACRVDAGNLWVLPSGSRSNCLTSILAVDRLAARIKELRESFDYVLINVPGADKYSDATAIGRLADGAILVVEANSPPREAVQRTKHSLDSGGVRLLGAVLNNRQYPIPRVLYNRLG